MKEIASPRSIAEAGELLRRGSLSSENLTRHYLAGIRTLQEPLNAFITISESQALESAKRLDAELRSGGDRGPLHGIPIVHKDNFDTAGVVTTVGSELFRNRLPSNNATVVEALEQAGAVMLAKTNMNEFAAGLSGTNKAFGDIHNPWDLLRSPGGSSGGSAVAVAAGLCLGATGTDTGGSIRIPASWCGVSGIRPSFGRVDTTGVYPRAFSLDCAGPIARTVTDLAVLLTIMTGTGDGSSPATHDFLEGLDQGIQGVRIGVVDDFTFRDVDDDVKGAVQDALGKLQALGASVIPVRIPLLSKALDYQLVFKVLLAEFAQILRTQYEATPNRENIFGPVVQSDLKRAAAISSVDYAQAIEVRSSQIGEVRSIFSKVDVLITPTMPSVAPKLSAPLSEFDRGRQFTLPFGFLKLPALSIPCGYGASHMPIGMQIIADHFNEAVLLRLGEAYQSVTTTHFDQPAHYWNG